MQHNSKKNCEREREERIVFLVCLEIRRARAGRTARGGKEERTRI